MAAGAYVAAVSILLAVTREQAPPTLSASMRVREVGFLARLTEPGSVSPARSACKALLSLPLQDQGDRWTAVAACLRLGAPEAAWRLLIPLVDHDPLARVLVQWTFDVGVDAARRVVGLDPAQAPPLFKSRPVANEELVKRAMALPVDEGLRADVARVVAHLAGLSPEAHDQLATRKWLEALWSAAIFAAVILALLAAGVVLWVRSPRWALCQDPWSRPCVADMLPLVRVLVWFMAIHLTMSLLLPAVLDRAGYVAETGPLMLGMTVVGGMAVIALVRVMGLGMPGERTLQALGFSPHGPIWRSLAFGAATFAMAWPVYLGSSLVAMRLGISTETDPTSVYVLASPTGLLAAVVVAPLVEEPLFRGFLFRRLSTRFSVPLAAAISGAVFALAHMSLSTFLPLAAIGFSLAIGYARTRDILTPVVAHAAWNLSQAVIILTLYG